MTRPGIAQTKKGAAPTKSGADLAAGKVAESRAHGNREIKDGEDAIALAIGIKVGEDGGGKDAEGCLADADQSLTDVEGPIAVNPDGSKGSEAPEHGSGNDKGLAREAVAEPSSRRSGNHVKEEERRRQRAHLVIGGVEVALDQRKFAG